MNFPDSLACEQALGVGCGSLLADALLIQLDEYWPSSFLWHFYGVRIISFRLICFFLSRQRTLSGEMYSEYDRLI